MIHTILIANRGEIACRIIRTCEAMGIRALAIYADADAQAVYVKQAHRAYHLPGGTVAETYLNQEKIIAIARQAGADAIHPGYGFLSENASFAQACADAGITFIGPHPQAIAEMGSKSRAKALMKNHGVPVVPGYEGSDQSTTRFLEEAEKTGYPVLLKAAAGGGGKGMRIVHSPLSLPEDLLAAKREAQAAFGDEEILMEKYFPAARHIEFQIFGDKLGHTVHLFERECSIQRRYQKIMEESPSPALDDATRQAMGEKAVLAAQALAYDNAGTVEFIYAGAGHFYFLEINTRLQVEHPVTEMITGLDLVEWQIRVARGEALPLSQQDISAKGYALEFRLYAEDATRNFQPATGQIIDWKIPTLPGLRIDSGVESGSHITPHYDPMIAKIIVWGHHRQEAMGRMNLALRQLLCLGLTTNQSFLLALTENDDVIKGNYDTHFLQNKLDASQLPPDRKEATRAALIAATVYTTQLRQRKPHPLSHLPAGWRNNYYQPQWIRMASAGEEYLVQYRLQDGNKMQITQGEYNASLADSHAQAGEITYTCDGIREKWSVAADAPNLYLQHLDYGRCEVTLLPRYSPPEQAEEKGSYHSPLPGQVIKILVKPGQKVENGDTLIILSSMKMENTITANAPGNVLEIFVAEGQNIAAGLLLLKIADAATA